MTEKQPDISFPNNIRPFRKKAGMTLNDVADCIGVSPMSISYLERGKVKMSREQAEALARLFEVDVIDLFLRPDRATV